MLPDASTSQALVPIALLFLSALGVLVAASGLIYRALHNLGRDLREEMRLLREEMHSEFRRLENITMSHQHDDDGFPIVRFRPSDDD